MTASMFNLRVEPDMKEILYRAAARAQLRPSVWAREVLAAVACSGITMDDLRVLAERAPNQRADLRSPHPGRFLALQESQARREARSQVCSHPLTAIRQLPFTDVCGLCGVVVRRR